jgi:3-methyladenine DNA glycosylase AlkD
MEYLERIHALLSERENHEKAVGMAKYMKFHFPYLGVQKPQRSEALNPLIKQITKSCTYEEILNLIQLLWDKPEREFQYVAMDILFASKSKWKESLIQEVELLIRTKSWWDSVDMLATQIAGNYFRLFPENKYRIVREWIKDENKWINRTAILFQLKYKVLTDTELLTEAMIPHISSSDFFLQKAIGWALREFSATNPEWVQLFLEEHNLKPLSIREAKRGVKRSLEKRQ